jgi:ComF family protein
MHPWLENLLALLFPEPCAGCQRLGALFCDQCQAQLRPYPAEQRRLPAGLDTIAVAYTFEWPLREAVHHLKYSGKRRMAQPLGQLLAEYLRNQPGLAAPVLAVPLHGQRLAERGFNQADELAQTLARYAKLPVVPPHLVRKRDTGHQAQLKYADRQANMHDAFVWQSTTPPPTRVLLIDDVLTTGATMAACALALRAAGTQSVLALALGRSRLEP